jgi:hypothetical protein
MFKLVNKFYVLNISQAFHNGRLALVGGGNSILFGFEVYKYSKWNVSIFNSKPSSALLPSLY